MNTYRQLLFHIVFCTHNRQNTLVPAYHDALYKFIGGIIRNRKGVVYNINGTENHIHILSDLHPTVPLSDFVKEIKTASNRWIKESGHFPEFSSWAQGCCELTYTYRDRNMISNYISGQKEHHKKATFEEEYRALLKEHGIEWDEKYLF